MFRGITAVNLDPKGRLAMPVRYRQYLLERDQGNLVVTVDTEQRCLLLYPLATWENIEAQLESLPSFDPAARRIQRLLIGHATEVEMDGQGRILLPPLLREYAVMGKKIVLVGQGKKLELWDEGLWQTSREQWLNQQDGLPSELSVELKSIAL